MTAAIANVVRVSIYVSALSEIPQDELQSDVNQRQYGEGVAEWLVNDVPEMENFLRT